ncbi:MAG TPA: hypothetical protein VMJ32_17620 [Pirellulales bacterium]|nr:hypothetical protein [Pirellulales bacterium]
MPTDLLEQLAELPVPPAPPTKAFDRAIHRRINSRLIVGQICDFLFRGFGFAIVHFVKAALGVVQLTVTGKLPTKTDRGPGPM